MGMTDGKAILDVRGLRKSFGGSAVLQDISLSVAQGDVVAVLGPSGSGKTTLLRCLNFLERADAGVMTFDGESLDMPHAAKRDILRIRRKTAFVFQNFNLFRNRTALGNITEGLVVGRGVPRREAEARGRELLAKVGLADRADFYPNQLSGGQQQRVAIARALAAKPEIIYFDEPTSALDPQLKEEILVVMQGLAEEGMTMIVVTHEMAFAKNVSNKVLMMDGGVVIEARDAPSFFAEPREARSKAFLASFAEPKTAARPAGAEPRSTAS